MDLENRCEYAEFSFHADLKKCSLQEIKILALWMINFIGIPHQIMWGWLSKLSCYSRENGTCHQITIPTEAVLLDFRYDIDSKSPDLAKHVSVYRSSLYMLFVYMCMCVCLDLNESSLCSLAIALTFWHACSSFCGWFYAI